MSVVVDFFYFVCRIDNELLKLRIIHDEITECIHNFIKNGVTFDQKRLIKKIPN